MTGVNVANFGPEAMEAKCLLMHRTGNIFSIAMPDDGFLLDGRIRWKPARLLTCRQGRIGGRGSPP
jgi:hypothetical protein